MKSVILRMTARVFLPLAVLFSAFLLLRGHNAPGGGFAAGLVAASGVAFGSLTFGPAWGKQLLRFDPRTLMGWGLALSLASGAPALALDQPFLSGLWREYRVPGLGVLALGTPLLFDVGVFLLVFGAASIIVLSLAEES